MSWTKGLAIALDLRFERFGQDRVGDPQHQNRGHPTRDQDGDDDIEALEAPARPAPQFVLLLHDFDPTARSVFGCFVGEATGDFMPVQLRTATSPGALAAIINRPSQQIQFGCGARGACLRCANCLAETLSPARFAARLRDCSDGDLI